MIHRPLSTAFLDMFCNIALIFLLLINPNRAAEIQTPFELALYLKWDEGLVTDVDIYVEGPNGKTLFFQQKDVVWATLSKDDLGEHNDDSLKNLEVVEFRAPLDGTYWISVHTYARPAAGTVSVELWDRKRGMLGLWSAPIPPNRGEEGVWQVEILDGKVVDVQPSSLQVRKKLLGGYGQ